MWNEFVEPDFDLPNIVVENLADGFEKKTNNFASLRTIEMKGFKRKDDLLSKSFQYSIVLLSKYIENYSFEVGRFSYDVDCYPLEMILNEGILDELGDNSFGDEQFIFKLADQAALIALLQRVFGSNKFRNTVGGLMKIVRIRILNNKLEDDLPF